MRKNINIKVRSHRNREIIKGYQKPGILGRVLIILLTLGVLTACGESSPVSMEGPEDQQNNTKKESVAAVELEGEHREEVLESLHRIDRHGTPLMEVVNRVLWVNAIEVAESEEGKGDQKTAEMETEDQSEPKEASESESKPEPDPEPEPEPKPEPKPEPDPEPKPEPDPEPEPKPEPEPDPEPEPEPTPYSDLYREYDRFVKDNTVRQSIEQEVVSKINAARKERGASSLKVSKELTSMARIKSTDMAVNDYFSHTSPEYGSPFDMAKFFGIGLRSENIYYSSREVPASQVHSGFMDSEGHRSNRMNSGFQEVGIGIVVTGNGFYVTELFR